MGTRETFLLIQFQFQFVVILVLLIITPTSTSYHEDEDEAHLSYTIRDDVCTNVDCGEGKCVPDVGGVFYHCDCYPGWKTLQIGLFTLPTCLVPNCTLNFTCGPPLFTLAPFNLSSPCNLVWCGDGTCMVNGTQHYCQCNNGSANLFGKPDNVCMKQCYFGGDCAQLLLNLGKQQQPQSQSPPPPPPPTSGSSGSAIGSKKEASNCWRRMRTLPKLIIAVLTTTTFLTWVV